jgi:hypothetical protein
MKQIKASKLKEKMDRDMKEMFKGRPDYTNMSPDAKYKLFSYISKLMEDWEVIDG